MNIIKFCFVVLLFLNNTCKSKEPVKMMTNNPSEVIIYGKKESGLSYKDGLFIAHEKNEATKINKVVENYNITVKPIGSEIKDTSSNVLPLMFSVIINPKEAKHFCDELNAISIIDGAYIKPSAEEPSIDDMN